MLAIVIPLTVQAKTDPNEVDLEVTNLSKQRLGSCYYKISYRLYNNGPDDIVNEDFWDVGGYDGWTWYIYHENFSLEANQYSPYYYWEGYIPAGFHLYSICTDVYDDVDETNENNNCKVKLWFFY